VGSRFSRHSVLLNYPFRKIVANRAFHLLAQLVLLRRFRDLTNNLKLMRREVAERLQLRQPGFAVNAETGLQPLLMGCKIREVPISWIDRTPDMEFRPFSLGAWAVDTCGAPLRMAEESLWQGPYRDLVRMGAHRKGWRGPEVPPEVRG